MGESVVQPRNIQIMDGDGKNAVVTARGHVGRIEYGDEGKYPGYEGLGWRTFRFQDLDASVMDGALAEINPGKRTPLELVEADKVFSEVPLEGEVVLLHLDHENKISAYHFDSRRSKDNSLLFEIVKGEAFCLIALGQKPVKVLEFEEPGFTESDLKIIATGEKEVSGRKIPDELWAMIEQLEKGEVKDTVVPVLELSDLP